MPPPLLSQMREKNALHIILYGNPVDGFSVRGPFDTYDDACDYAERVGEGDWWIAELTPPDPTVGTPHD